MNLGVRVEVAQDATPGNSDGELDVTFRLMNIGTVTQAELDAVHMAAQMLFPLFQMFTGHRFQAKPVQVRQALTVSPAVSGNYPPPPERKTSTPLVDAPPAPPIEGNWP